MEVQRGVEQPAEAVCDVCECQIVFKHGAAHHRPARKPVRGGAGSCGRDWGGELCGLGTWRGFHAAVVLANKGEEAALGCWPLSPLSLRAWCA
jgi:hypothetical protein